MIIGITGKSGSGKSTLANVLGQKRGYYIVHIDEIAHSVLRESDVQQQLIAIFGSKVMSKNKIDRKLLGERIFTERHAYKEVVNIIWAKIKKEIDLILTINENVILDWLLLPHTHYWKLCDYTILVKSDEQTRVKKVLARDKISKEYLEKRDAAGINFNKYKFNIITYNNYKDYSFIEKILKKEI